MLDGLEHDSVSLSARYCAAILEAGIRLMSVGRWYVSFSHTDADIDHTIEASREIWPRDRTPGS